MQNKMIKAQSIVGTSKGRPENDFYSTPKIAVEKILERIAVPKYAKILEPCCGVGNISEVLKSKGYNNVVSSDLIYRGYKGTIVRDFLSRGNFGYDTFDYIITNPPFKLAEEFILKSLDVAPYAIMLLKLQFLEGSKRYNTLFKNEILKEVYVFSSRLTMTREDKKMKNKGMICFAWFVFHRFNKQEPKLYWI